MMRFFLTIVLSLLIAGGFGFSEAAETERKLRYKVFNIAEYRPGDWDQFRIRDYKKKFDHDFQSENILDYDYVFIILNSWSDAVDLKPVSGYPLPQVIQTISSGTSEGSVISGDLNFANDVVQIYYAMSNAGASEFCFAKYVLDEVYGLTKKVRSERGSKIDLSLYGVC